LDEHEKWFKTKIKDSYTSIYIACSGKDKVGSIRFEDKGEAVKVNVMLNPDFLGKGLGSKIIKLGTEKFIKQRHGDKQIIAEIKRDNIASIKAFQKAGFEESHLTLVYRYEQ
jgi:RimJ/RimL family protein N-acetyltransferase